MGGTAEGEFDCRYRKRDTKKANRIQGGVPVTTAPAEKFTPIGYGYGRGPQGQTINGYCKMYVTWTDCLLRCDREHACIGFDAEQSFNTHWQQCCIRTSTYKTVHGWSSFRGNGDKVAKATGRGVSNRLVMAKNQFYRVGSGYARGKNGARTHAYCKMYVSFEGIAVLLGLTLALDKSILGLGVLLGVSGGALDNGASLQDTGLLGILLSQCTLGQSGLVLNALLLKGFGDSGSHC